MLLQFKFTTGVNSFVVGGFSKEYAFHIVFTTEKWDFESESNKKTLIHTEIHFHSFPKNVTQVTHSENISD